MDFGMFEIGGLSVLILVAGWVEFSKKFGLSGNGLTVLAAVLGALLIGLAQAIAKGLIPPEIVTWIEIVVVGLGGGLAASGLYDLVKRLRA